MAIGDRDYCQMEASQQALQSYDGVEELHDSHNNPKTNVSEDQPGLCVAKVGETVSAREDTCTETVT